MNFNTEPIKNWFGFTRRERRSTFTLLVLIVVVLIIRYAVPKSNATVIDLTAKVFVSENDQKTIKSEGKKTGEVNFKKTGLKKGTGKASSTFSPSKAGYTTYQIDRKRFNKTIDINLSDTSELISLPGIGSVLSARIVKYRNFLGGFARIEQLKEVYGLSEETYEMLKKRVSADSAFINRIDINSADYKELTRVRYLDKYEISSILKYRQLKGRIINIGDMVDNKLVTNDKAQRIRPYFRFD